jgi:hypothetical protein
MPLSVKITVRIPLELKKLMERYPDSLINIH